MLLSFGLDRRGPSAQKPHRHPRPPASRHRHAGKREGGVSLQPRCWAAGSHAGWRLLSASRAAGGAGKGQSSKAPHSGGLARPRGHAGPHPAFRRAFSFTETRALAVECFAFESSAAAERPLHRAGPAALAGPPPLPFPSHAERLSLQPLGQVQTARVSASLPAPSTPPLRSPWEHTVCRSARGSSCSRPCRWRNRRPPSRCPRHPGGPARPCAWNRKCLREANLQAEAGSGTRGALAVSREEQLTESVPRLSLHVASGAPWGQAWFPLLGPSFSPHAAHFPLTRGRLLVLKHQRCIGSASERGASE